MFWALPAFYPHPHFFKVVGKPSSTHPEGKRDTDKMSSDTGNCVTPRHKALSVAPHCQFLFHPIVGGEHLLGGEGEVGALSRGVGFRPQAGGPYCSGPSGELDHRATALGFVRFGDLVCL